LALAPAAETSPTETVKLTINATKDTDTQRKTADIRLICLKAVDFVAVVSIIQISPRSVGKFDLSLLVFSQPNKLRKLRVNFNDTNVNLMTQPYNMWDYFTRQ
jgi:hypothetical protein